MKGWTQARLQQAVQEHLGDERVLHLVTLSRFENDRSVPSAEMLSVLAQALSTTTDYLLGLSDEPSTRHNDSAQNEPRAGAPADLQPLLDRLSRQDPEDRAEWVRIFTNILDASDHIAAAEEEDLPPKAREFVRLLDLIPEDKMDEVRRMLEEEVAQEEEEEGEEDVA